MNVKAQKQKNYQKYSDINVPTAERHTRVCDLVNLRLFLKLLAANVVAETTI